MFIDHKAPHPLGFKFEDIFAAMVEAGDKITEIYLKGDFATSSKEDGSPLTKADLAAHSILYDRLKSLTPNIPVISEESDNPLLDFAECGRYAWLVDPLDGTKEFVNKTGEFTVNVALLDGLRPQCGFVYVPMTQELYYGLGQGLAFKRDRKGRIVPCQVRAFQNESFVCLMSRRHGQMREDLESLVPGCEVRYIGSSLKGCLIAEGIADVYVRLGPTSRWDTAAMQAIVESAGGAVVTLDGKSLQYDRTSILNPDFVTIGADRVPWREVVSAIEQS